jgi:methionyl-tRNA formyltransferase
MALRLVFMGTPDFAVPTLAAIVGGGHEVASVYTRAPKPAGRGMDVTPSPVEREARRFGLPVLTPATLKPPDAEAVMRSHGAHAAVVVAYGLILPQAILDVFPLGAFNLHASLLPRWRGAAPINRAIMAGDRESGVTVMKMAAGLDTGDIAMNGEVPLIARLPIGADMTAGDLHDELAQLGAGLMVRALGALERLSLTLSPQPAEGMTYATKIDKAESRIDWSFPWNKVHDHIRGLSPFPGAWFEMPGEKGAARIKVLRSTRGEGSGPPGTLIDDRLTVACGEGAVRILELQRAGRQAMKAQEFLRGSAVAVGTRFG